MAMTVPPAVAEGRIPINLRMSGLSICLFFQHPVLTPPPLLPLQTQIVFESRLGVHDVLNDCTMTVD